MAAIPEVSLSVAALHLDTSPGALRKLFARAVKASNGRSEARINGVRARKRGRLWRVRFDSPWTRNGVLVRWRSAENVARELGCAPDTLRRALQRRRSSGSTREVTLRGCRSAARKLGDRWKLLLSPTAARRGRGDSPHV